MDLCVIYLLSLRVQVPVGEAIAGAFMAVLPGIDANDPSKCLTVFRFYCLALSSLPMLPVSCSSSLNFTCGGGYDI